MNKKRETFLQTYVRTAIHAKFRTNDYVPILTSASAFAPISSSVNELSKKSGMDRFFDKAWLLFAACLTGGYTILGILMSFKPEFIRGHLLVAAFMVIIWIFCVIQFTSIVGYWRFRLKNKG